MKFFKSKSNLILFCLILFGLYRQFPTIENSFKVEGKTLKTINLLDTKGNKVTFPQKKKTAVIFWATWCGPCHIQMNIVEKLINKKQLNKESIVAISLGESIDEVNGFLKKNSFSFKVFIDTKGIGWKEFNILSTPSMMLLDKNNTVDYFTFGISPLFPQRAQRYLHAL